MTIDPRPSLHKIPWRKMADGSFDPWDVATSYSRFPLSWGLSFRNRARLRKAIMGYRERSVRSAWARWVPKAGLKECEV